VSRGGIDWHAMLVVASVIAMASACSHGRATRTVDSGAFLIEKPPLMISSTAKPRYPAELLATRDTGTVLVRVDVEPSGRADMRSVAVVASSHAAFTREALAVLAGARFLPAEVEQVTGCRTAADGVERCPRRRPGKKLRQTVTIPFVFRPPPLAPPNPSPPPR